MTDVINPTVAQLTARSLLGRKRTLLLMLLPLALLGSAAVFAVIHPPVSFLPVFVLGVVAAIAFERTRLLWAPIAAHAVYNASLVIWPA